MPDPVLGHRPFADGATRAVRLDAAGKQYVLGSDGERVYGTWLVPAFTGAASCPAPSAS
jgi:hypothetical protein